MSDYKWLIRGIVLGIITGTIELTFVQSLVFIIGFGFLMALEDD